MNTAFQYYASRALRWAPDFSRTPLRRQAVIGAIVSLLFHLLLFIVLLATGLVVPQRNEPPPLAVREELEVEIMPAKAEPEPDPNPSVILRRPTIEPRGLQAAAEPPPKPQFDSSQDMKAGSELPAQGLLPLPSQEGRTDNPANDFADQEIALSLASGTTTLATPPPPPPESDAQRSSEPPPPSTLPPLYAPQPVATTALAEAQKADPAQPLPETARPARATPPPLEKVVQLRPDQFAVTPPKPVPEIGPLAKLDPAPPPRPLVKPTPRKAAATPAWLPMLATPEKFGGKSASQQFREQLRKGRIEGSITNRGAPGVDAVATAEERWWKRSRDAIKQNWYLFMDQAGEGFLPGTRVSVSFTIDRDGHTHDIHAAASTGDSLFVEVCTRAIRETPVPVPPPDIIEPFANGRIEQVINFAIY